jgi:hypothetical protein
LTSLSSRSSSPYFFRFHIYMPISELDKQHLEQVAEQYKDNHFQQSLVSFFLYLYVVVCVYDCYRNVTKVSDLFYIAFGLYVGDLCSGLIHVFLDHKRIDDASCFLDTCAHAFQVHHQHPKAFYDRTMVTATRGQREILTYLCYPAMFFAKLIITNNNLLIFTSTLLLCLAVSQVTHAYAHMNQREIPVVIRQLQKCGFALRFEDHQKHHQQGALSFCIVNGWSNSLLNFLYGFVLRPMMNRFPTVFD